MIVEGDLFLQLFCTRLRCCININCWDLNTYASTILAQWRPYMSSGEMVILSSTVLTSTCLKYLKFYRGVVTPVKIYFMSVPQGQPVWTRSGAKGSFLT